MKRYSSIQIITIIFSIGVICISLGIVAFYYFKKPSQKENASCAVQECHGPFYSCGEKPTYTCSGGTQIGDLCEQFAVCEEINNTCNLKESPKLQICQECSRECTNFQCISECMNKKG